MSGFRVADPVRFRTMTPDGPLSGAGVITKIFPTGTSYWLHVRQEDGSVRMLFEATTTIDVLELEAA